MDGKGTTTTVVFMSSRYFINIFSPHRVSLWKSSIDIWRRALQTILSPTKHHHSLTMSTKADYVSKIYSIATTTQTRLHKVAHIYREEASYVNDMLLNIRQAVAAAATAAAKDKRNYLQPATKPLKASSRDSAQKFRNYLRRSSSVVGCWLLLGRNN